MTQQGIDEDNQGLSWWVSHWSSAVTCLRGWSPEVEKNRICRTFRKNSWKIHKSRLSFFVLTSNLHRLYLNFCDKTFGKKLLFDVNNAVFMTSSLYQISCVQWLPIVWSSRIVQNQWTYERCDSRVNVLHISHYLYHCSVNVEGLKNKVSLHVWRAPQNFALLLKGSILLKA